MHFGYDLAKSKISLLNRSTKSTIGLGRSLLNSSPVKIEFRHRRRVSASGSFHVAPTGNGEYQLCNNCAPTGTIADDTTIQDLDLFQFDDAAHLPAYLQCTHNQADVGHSRIRCERCQHLHRPWAFVCSACDLYICIDCAIRCEESNCGMVYCRYNCLCPVGHGYQGSLADRPDTTSHQRDSTTYPGHIASWLWRLLFVLARWWLPWLVFCSGLPRASGTSVIGLTSYALLLVVVSLNERPF